MHCDKHVCKMIIEYAQMLSTAHRVLDGTEYTELSKAGRKVKRWRHPNSDFDEKLMKATHVNHKSNVWVRKNKSTYRWTYNLFKALLWEYFYRYSKVHACNRLTPQLSLYPKSMSAGDFCPPPPAMPEIFVQESIVLSYREFYKKEKKSFARWHRDETKGPPWFYS